MKEPYLRSIRLLAECYQAFEQLSASHVRTIGLTPSQFDIITTLGNTPGMSCKELGEKTLITKGTLTGVLSRLEAKGLIRRSTCHEDRRSLTIALTTEGEDLFRQVFPKHISFCKQYFLDYSNEDFAALNQELSKLGTTLKAAVEKNQS